MSLSKKLLCLSVASAVFLGAFAPLLAVEVNAQTSIGKGAWTFEPNGSNVQITAGAGFFDLNDYGWYSIRSAVQEPTLDGVMGTPHNNIGNITLATIQGQMTSFYNNISTRPNGIYYFLIANDPVNTGTYNAYYEFEVKDGEIFPRNIEQGQTYQDRLAAASFAGAYNTRFLTTSASGDRAAVVFNTQYFIDTAELLPSNRPDALFVSVSKVNVLDALNVGTTKTFILPLVYGTTTKTHTLDFPLDANSTFDVNIYFWNINNDVQTFKETSISARLTTNNQAVSTFTILKVYNNLNPSELAYEECSITKLSGCLNNSLRFLFVPTPSVVDGFFQSLDSLNTKVPFVYLSQGVTLINSIYNQPSASLPSISVPFLSGSIPIISPSIVNSYPFVSLLRNLMAAGMWVTVLYGLYRMALGIHNRDTV